MRRARGSPREEADRKRLTGSIARARQGAGQEGCASQSREEGGREGGAAAARFVEVRAALWVRSLQAGPAEKQALQWRRVSRLRASEPHRERELLAGEAVARLPVPAHGAAWSGACARRRVEGRAEGSAPACERTGLSARAGTARASEDSDDDLAR